MRAAAAVLVAVACTRSEPPQGAPSVVIADAAAVTVSALASLAPAPVAAPPASVCRPLVLNRLCVRPCTIGRREDAGTYTVDGYPEAHARLERSCDDGGCAEVLAADVSMGGGCIPRPIDKTCHFEGVVCKGSAP